MKVIRNFLLAASAVVCVVTPAIPQKQETLPSIASQQSAVPQMSQAPLLSPSQRSAIADELIAKWQGTVRKQPGGNVARWSDKLRDVIATADAENVLRASTVTTSLEIVHATLHGYIAEGGGAKSGAIGNAAVQPQVLGSTIADTTYTPLPSGRCRIADSRAMSPSLPLPAGVTRGLYVDRISTYASQGGTGTYSSGNGNVACGIPAFATAFAISVTLLSPAGNGVFKVFPFGAPYQTGNSVLFNAGDYGANGDLIVRNCQNCNYEIGINTSGASVHYIIDVVGYFMPPQATPLSCYYSSTSKTIANGAHDYVQPAGCSAGYQPMGTECHGGRYLVQLNANWNGLCSFTNGSGHETTIAGRVQCCRVPGR